jgi:hypothetical protein
MNYRFHLDTLALNLDSFYSAADLQRMNRRFVAAMAAAIRAGLEQPPRVGIDRTPGTKSPMYLSPPR